MKCIYCTADIPDGSTVCEYCGKNQTEEKVEHQIAHNNEEKQYTPIIVKQNPTILILLLISIIVCGIACFLPYFSLLGVTQNYVLSGDKICDGIFILGFGVLSIVLMFMKKRIPVVIFQALSCAVFFYDYYHQKQSIYSDLMSRMYGVGFYLLFIFLIISLILSIIRLIKSDVFA